MKRITRLTSAAFGMLLLGGLAYYQGRPGLATGDEDVLVGTALAEGQAENKTPDSECESAADTENSDLEDCQNQYQ